MAGLLDPSQGDGSYVENRPSKWAQTWGILGPYVTEPFNAMERLWKSPAIQYGFEPSEQDVADSFNIAGSVVGAGSVVPKPDDALNMGIKAFHGSPHDFDRFSLDKIGTGEGAQAYGHGLYFAENEGVAKGYRDTLAKNKNIDGAMIAAWERAAKLGDALKDPSIEVGSPQFKAAQAEYMKAIEEAKNMVPTNPGRMYEVEIDADPNAFLDWDKPLSEQPEAVRQALQPRIDRLRQAGARIGDDPDGAMLWRVAHPQPGVDELTFSPALPVQATNRLREAGIPGIKYLDAGSRYTPGNLPDNPIANEARHFLDAAQGDADAALRLFRESNPVERWAGPERDEITQVIKAAAKPVTRNYVVFDDNLINIIRKYGIAGLLGGSAAMDAMMSEPQEQY